jgi:hypothetical protein
MLVKISLCVHVVGGENQNPLAAIHSLALSFIILCLQFRWEKNKIFLFFFQHENC